MNLADDLIGFDHRDVKALLDRFEKVPHRSTAMEICELLERHEQMEAEILHPVLRAADLERAEADEREHEEIAVIVAKMRDATKRSELKGYVAELRPILDAHVKTEENKTLPMLEDRLGVSEMNKLGFRIGEFKRSYEREGEDLDELLEMSRAELYEKAKLADVSGRSNMNKSELAEALAGV